MKNKDKNINPKIKCDVKDCTHNCNSDCMCELETISVCTCTNEDQAKTQEGTACNSYKCK